MRRIFGLSVMALAHATFAVLSLSGAHAALACRTAEVQDQNMCQKVCDTIKAANGAADHLSIFKFMDVEGVTFDTATNRKLWALNKAAGYASPDKITSCKVERIPKGGCRITMCGLLPDFRERSKANLNKLIPDTSRYTQPKPHIGPPGLLESDTAVDRQGPSAIGTPVDPAGGAGAAPTYSRGSR